MNVGRSRVLNHDNIREVILKYKSQLVNENKIIIVKDIKELWNAIATETGLFVTSAYT